MKKNRREFLGISLALGAAPLLHASPFQALKFNSNPRKMKILILGGTSFLGPHQIAYALERGHQVSTFTRGKTIPKIHPELFSKVEQLVGDRADNLDALKNRKWDVVIDNSGREAKWTEDTAQLLKDQVGIYMYTSSISVYYPFTGTDFSEGRSLIREIPSDVAEDKRATYAYGVMKANSELAALKHFGSERCIIVRPTLIVGPGDRTDRFPYWTARLQKGGAVIIPGKSDELVQYIDVRDLAEWMIRLLEDQTVGIYNGSGPGFKMTTKAFVHGIHANYNSPIQYTQIDDIEFLQENQLYAIQPWVIQLPEYAGMSLSDNSKSVASGLRFRPLAKTVQATDEWWYSDAVSQERRDNILAGERSFMQREEEILSKWRSRKK